MSRAKVKRAPLGGVRAEERRQARNVAHWVTFALLVLATLLFSVFRFGAVFFRTGQAFEDVGRSFAAAFAAIAELDEVRTTVQEFPGAQMQRLLPLTVDDVAAFFDRFGQLFINGANVASYFEKVLDVVVTLFKCLIPVAIILAGFALVVVLVYRDIDTHHGDTRPLALFRKIKRATWNKARRAVVRFIDFFFEHRWMKWVFIVLWAYNFNLLTIALEVIAFLLYVAMTGDVLNIVVQVAKLVIDFSVPVFFFPVWAWAIIAYLIMHLIRVKIGEGVRDFYVAQIEKFLEDHPGSLFVTGKQRSKKTSLLTTFKIVLERVFRKKAKEKFAARNRQFPRFDWARIDALVQDCRRRRVFVKFKDIRRFATRLQGIYENRGRPGFNYDAYRRLFFKWYGYDVDEFFAYAEEERMTYDNGIVNISIFEAIAAYGQLFFIYSQLTPLDVSNYSIREDFEFKDYGCFPVFDGDLFKPPKESEQATQYSHIINFDNFRLGEVMDPETAYDTAIEYGIGVEHEWAKERKNKATKKVNRSETGANQDNDFFELDVKMRGHVATIDNFTFWRWLFDDQRAGSLGADNKDLTTICLIKKSTDEKCFLPFFDLEPVICAALMKFRDWVYYHIHARKNKNTLLMFLLDSLLEPFFSFVDRQKNRFSVSKVKLKTTDGADGEVLSAGEIVYILTAMTYNDRYATDAARSYYDQKHEKARYSLDDVEQYDSLRPTTEQYAKQRSFADADMQYAFGGKRTDKVPKRQAGKGLKTG